MKFLPLVSTTLLLVACGGGGGSGGSVSAPTTPSAVLTSANQTVVAQEVIAASFMPLLGGRLVTGARAMDASVLFSLARAQLVQLPAYLAGAKANSALSGAIQSQTVSCGISGSLTVSVSDADNNGVVSAGDSLTIAANNCVEASVDGVITGSLGLTFNSLTGTFETAPYSFEVMASFSNFTLTSGTQFSASANGSLSLSANVTGANSFTETVSTPALTIASSYAGVMHNLSLSSYSAMATRTPDAAYAYLSSYVIHGTLSSSALSSQTVSFDTSSPFVTHGMDHYPSVGMMVIKGASNSEIRITALSNSQVTEELDANGDDIYESSTTVAWSSLM